MAEKMNFEEIHDLALRLSAEPPFTAENVYVDLLLTSAIGEIQPRFGFVLKGGTAVIKAWFPPYRFSYDLDFSHFAGESPRKQYRRYQKELEKLVSDLGFRIVNPESDKHREGGKVFVLKLLDTANHLRVPVKLSVSSIDESPCFNPVTRDFKPLVEIPEKYELLYPAFVRKVSGASAVVLTPEELCAEKIRALATRGPGREWSLLLRDVVDVREMDERGVLDTVLDSEKCLRKKFNAVRGTSYWRKFADFLSKPRGVKIREEDLSIFFHPDVIDEKSAARTVEKVRARLAEIFDDV
ncbi:MAG: nucleotidyl transferase AbiEii/AbiGii toxin family protein [Candidatus Micrarchaeota archaeon]